MYNKEANNNKLLDQFEKLKQYPQPKQRTREWFDYRYNRITASDTATAIDLNPYEPVESFILRKCDSNYPFYDNATVFHGKKYEPIATLLYEHIYNNKVEEFGALPSLKYSFLGASPDGICSNYTLDNKISSRLGIMLEIKCPVTRYINTKGNIFDICPFYYYCQIQQQLLCCELDICDFWQCKFTEFNSREEYLKDDFKTCINTENTEIISDTIITHTFKCKSVTINNKLKKGIILEFYPKNFIPEFETDNIEWKSKYIIPTTLDMNENEYDIFVTEMLNTNKSLLDDYYFNKIIYWKLDKTHNISIMRNDKFLLNIIPILEITWKLVLFYRKNKDKLDELRDIIEKRKKYNKFNTKFTIHNQYIINNKILFLDSNKINTAKISLNNIINNNNNNDNYDFIDD